MPIEDHWLLATMTRAPRSEAPSFVGLHANHRIAELLNEAAQERLARLAHEVRRAGPERPRPAARHRLVRSALSALSGIARRLERSPG
jgi:hypothetical protein